MRARGSKDAKRRSPHRVGEREGAKKGEKRALAPLLYVFVPGAVLCKLGRPGVLLVLPEVLTPFLGPLFYFHRLSLPGLLATAILDFFPILST